MLYSLQKKHLEKCELSTEIKQFFLEDKFSKEENTIKFCFLHRINSILDHCLATYENIILIGDFNLCVENRHLEATLENYDLDNQINMPTCYLSNDPTCIDLILTNKKNLFKLSDTFETSFRSP